MAATLTGSAYRGLGGINADATKLAEFLADAYAALSAAERLVHSPHGFVVDKAALDGVDHAELERLVGRVKNQLASVDAADVGEALGAAEVLYDAVQNEIRRTDDA